MPQVKPFKAIVYNRYKIRKLSKVVAPPYDVILQDMQDQLYRSSPYNIVRLILGKIRRGDDASDNRYTRAQRSFSDWLKKGVMIKDKSDAIYIYSQTYKKDGRPVEQIGFLALMSLDQRSGRKVLPHENTLAAPKTDRLNLMRAVKANLCPIFVLYDDNSHKIVNVLKIERRLEKPFIDIYFDNVRHRVWALDDKRAIKKIARLMRSKDIFIADGHHRYEVACMYAAETRKKSSKYLMVYFVESDEEMLTILPAHRVVKDIGRLNKGDITKRLEKFFYMEKVRGIDRLISELSGLRQGRHGFGMYLGKDEFYRLRLKNSSASDAVIRSKPKEWKRLDVTILHLFILQHLLEVSDEDNNIEFFKDPHDAVRAVDENKASIAFFLNPTKVSQVKHIARLGEKMPRKATYFYPKPLSGLVINKH